MNMHDSHHQLALSIGCCAALALTVGCSTRSQHFGLQSGDPFLTQSKQVAFDPPPPSVPPTTVELRRSGPQRSVRIVLDPDLQDAEGEFELTTPAHATPSRVTVRYGLGAGDEAHAYLTRSQLDDLAADQVVTLDVALPDNTSFASIQVRVHLHWRARPVIVRSGFEVKAP